MTDRIDQIIEKLQQLKEIRQHLVNEPMSESGVWIHQYEVRKKYKKDGEIYCYVYAKWQSVTLAISCQNRTTFALD